MTTLRRLILMAMIAFLAGGEALAQEQTATDEKAWSFYASAYAYILESLKHYPAQNGVAAKMRELGMANVRIVNLLGGVMSINYGEKTN